VQLRARIMEKFEQVQQLSAEIDDHADSIEHMLNDAIERLEGEAVHWENSMLG
jgi:hypothetical protein